MLKVLRVLISGILEAFAWLHFIVQASLVVAMATGCAMGICYVLGYDRMMDLFLHCTAACVGVCAGITLLFNLMKTINDALDDSF